MLLPLPTGSIGEMFSSGFITILAATSFALGQGQTIVLTNDDGWAVANIRAQRNSLVAAGLNVVLSAPANDESGTGSLDLPATTVGSGGCEFASCAPGSPAEGFNASDTRLNYVNSFPVTSVKFGINTLSPKFFGSPPDFVVSGPNVGTNTGFAAFGSGTIGAACAAANAGIPSIAFSGASGDHVSFTTLDNATNPDTIAANVYSALGTKLTQTILATSKPFLPSGVSLNVNFPAISASCVEPSDFKFVLTRIFAAIPIITPNDVKTCGSSRLPEESDVIAMDGCFASVSVMDAALHVDATAATQAIVLGKLSSIVSCIPTS